MELPTIQNIFFLRFIKSFELFNAEKKNYNKQKKNQN